MNDERPPITISSIATDGGIRIVNITGIDSTTTMTRIVETSPQRTLDSSVVIGEGAVCGNVSSEIGLLTVDRLLGGGIGIQSAIRVEPGAKVGNVGNRIGCIDFANPNDVAQWSLLMASRVQPAPKPQQLPLVASLWGRKDDPDDKRTYEVVATDPQRSLVQLRDDDGYSLTVALESKTAGCSFADRFEPL